MDSASPTIDRPGQSPGATAGPKSKERIVLEELRRVALFGSGVAELTRNRAERMVKQWVRTGEIRKDQASQMVRSLLEVSEQSRQELAALVRSEIRNQVEGLGVASKRDVERLERRVTRLESSSKKARKKSTAKKSTRKTTGRAAPSRRGSSQ